MAVDAVLSSLGAQFAAVIWLLGCVTMFWVWILRWRRVSRTVRAGAPVVSGRAFEALHRLEPSRVLRIVSSDASFEPGVFGIVRPVLVWPRDIDTKLDEAPVDAITSFNRIVQNQTGLEGNYDFDFKWTNELVQAAAHCPGDHPRHRRQATNRRS